MKRTTVELGEVCDFLSGFAFKSELFSTEPIGLPIIRIRDVLPGSSATFYSGDYHPQYIIEKGDILIGMDGEFNRERWKSDVALLNQRVCKVIARERFVDNGYLYHALPMLLKKIEDETPFVTVKHLSVTKLKSAQIPLPPLEEQRRIAAILDKSNEILSLSRKSLGRFESLTDCIFVRMFGNPFSADSGRSHVPFREMTERITYGFTSPMAHMESGIPILTAKNIQDGFIDLENVHYARQDEFDALTSKCKPSPGDILITKDGSIGRCAIAPAQGPLCINQSVALVIPDRSRVVPEYVSAYVRCTPVQQRIQRMGKGNALKHLQITELAEFPSVIPPLAEQMKFADLISAVERKRDKSKEGVLWAERMARSLGFSLFECTFDKHQDLRKETYRQDPIAI
jgi:type I restriction enzyme S subunit